jgi:uncharacterized coiled-coil protein SlyX
MDRLIQLKQMNAVFAIMFLLIGVTVWPHSQAFGVVPAPDGGYPGFNTAEGQNALLHLTSGAGNTAVGWFSLESVTTGSFNTGMGAGTLLFNTADLNTAIGAGALLSNLSGVENTANGAFALFSNTNGGANTAFGFQALNNNTSANFNTAMGAGALRSNTTGDQNTAMGEGALLHNTEGAFNTAVGEIALLNNTSGAFNSAVGRLSLSSNTEGFGNTAVGFGALDQATGDNNVALGNSAGHQVTTATNVICIGANVTGFNVNDSCFIGNIYQKQVGNDSLTVLVDSSGKLGTMVSSRRFKHDIKPMGEASEAVLALKPVTFHYKSDATDTPQFGLIAEDVEKVNSELVVRDKAGKPYSVRYDAVNAMLLNEFLKAHRKVQELETNDAEQQREIKALVATVKEQAAQIQKVSAQLAAASPSRGGLEASRPASQVVNNP